MIDLQKQLHNGLGKIILILKDAFSQKKTFIFLLLKGIFVLFVRKRRRKKLYDRFYEKNENNSETFIKNNVYLMMILKASK
jgi:hypothetical protein